MNYRISGKIGDLYNIKYSKVNEADAICKYGEFSDTITVNSKLTSGWAFSYTYNNRDSFVIENENINVNKFYSCLSSRPYLGYPNGSKLKLGIDSSGYLVVGSIELDSFTSTTFYGGNTSSKFILENRLVENPYSGQLINKNVSYATVEASNFKVTDKHRSVDSNDIIENSLLEVSPNWTHICQEDTIIGDTSGCKISLHAESYGHGGFSSITARNEDEDKEVCLYFDTDGVNNLEISASKVSIPCETEFYSENSRDLLKIEESSLLGVYCTRLNSSTKPLKINAANLIIDGITPITFYNNERKGGLRYDSGEDKIILDSSTGMRIFTTNGDINLSLNEENADSININAGSEGEVNISSYNINITATNRLVVNGTTLFNSDVTGKTINVDDSNNTNIGGVRTNGINYIKTLNSSNYPLFNVTNGSYDNPFNPVDTGWRSTSWESKIGAIILAVVFNKSRANALVVPAGQELPSTDVAISLVCSYGSTFTDVSSGSLISVNVYADKGEINNPERFKTLNNIYCPAGNATIALLIQAKN